MLAIVRAGLLVMTGFVLWSPPVAAEETRIDIRVLARGAKFLAGHRSVPVTLRDAESGEVLARGWTAGGTGDTDRILKAPAGSSRQAPGDNAAVYTAMIDTTVRDWWRWKWVLLKGLPAPVLRSARSGSYLAGI